MLSKYDAAWKVLRVVFLTVAAVALITTLVMSSRTAVAGQSDKSASSQSYTSSRMPESTPEPSPMAPRAPMPQSVAVPAQCSGVNCTISSRAGWQQTSRTLKQGDPFSVAYVSGTWTVDKRSLPFVGPEGYSADVDSRIGYADWCKVKRDAPYAALLGKIDDGPAFLVGRGGNFTADRDGSLYLTLNDQTYCQGDNEGSVIMQIPTPQCARLYIDPPAQHISQSGRGTTAVQVANATNLYGVEFRLVFDSSVVQVVDADPNTPGVQVGLGSWFSGKDHFVARNQVSNGVIEFAVSLVAPTGPDGSGELAAITWQRGGTGPSALTLTQTKLSDRNGMAICHAVENGGIDGVVDGTGISGRVLLQGAQNHSGTNVFLTKELRLYSGKISALDLVGVPLSVTDTNGYFKVVPEPGQTYGWLWVFHPCYLTGQQKLPQPGNLGTLTLPAGDLNEDDRVNIFDLTIMGQRYGASGSCADFNRNGTVDIFDLVLVAGNLGKYGSVHDWQP
jgi:Dockerin type I domain